MIKRDNGKIEVDSIYNEYEKKHGKEIFRYLSAMLKKMEKSHQLAYQGKDFGQSWKTRKGSYVEKIIERILIASIKDLGLEIINGKKLIADNLSEDMDRLKRNLLIDYGEFGCHLPDVDLVIFNPVNKKVIAILSSKTTLRERVAQTAYWKLKLASKPITQHIKVYLVSPDEDNSFIKEKIKPTKNRAIVETDIDGTYLLTEEVIIKSNRIKYLSDLIDDIKKLKNDQD